MGRFPNPDADEDLSPAPETLDRGFNGELLKAATAAGPEATSHVVRVLQCGRAGDVLGAHRAFVDLLEALSRKVGA